MFLIPHPPRGYLGSMGGPELQPVGTNDADIEEMAALLRVVFPDSEHFTDEVVKWQYRDNPDGAVVGFNAVQGAVLTAHYVTIPFMAQVDGRTERGLLSLNTATHPAHQGKGLFTLLATETYAHAAKAGYGFVIGVANANSTHGFIKKLGFQLVSPLRAMVGMGPLPMRNGQAEPAYQRIWSDESLRWRLSHPQHGYTVRPADGMHLLLSERSKFGARYIMATRREGFGALAVAAEPGRVRSKVWIGLDPAMHWGGAAYMNVPMRFRPSPLNLIFKDLSGQGRKLDAARVRFHALDFDIL